MSMREQIMQIAQSDPKFAQAVDAMERAVVNMPIMPDDLDEGIETLEKIIKNPNKYAEIRSKAIADDMVDEEMLPEQYDQVYIVSLLVALYGLQDRISKKGYARGGLTVAARQLAAQGRGGDTELAHVNPREAAMLRRAGGSGTINPNTGLREYKSFLKKIKWGKVLAAVAPIALSFIPGIGTAIGGFLSAGLLSGTAASALGGAAIGAAASAIGGGNPLIGAVTGGIGGGLGDVLGGGINSALGLGLSDSTASLLGGAAAGAGASALQGRDPITGAITGAVGAGISGMGGLGIENADLNRAVAGATRGFGNALTAGQSPSEALTAGGLSGLGGLATGFLGQNPLGLPTLTSTSFLPGANAIPTPNALAAADASGSADPTGGAGADTTAPATADVATSSPLTQIAGAAAQPGATPAETSQFDNGVPVSSILNTTGQEGIQPLSAGDLSSGASLQALAPESQFNNGLPVTSLLNATNQPVQPLSESDLEYGQSRGALTDTARAATPASGSTLGRLAPLLAGGAAIAALSGMGSSNAPPAVQSAIRNLPANQQEYFNRPGVVWDWNKLATDAASSNLTLDQYMARNWNRVSSGEYNKAPAMAQGGLNAMARFVRGGGTGRSDEIDAKLSDGEYVIDAETVAMLGDGSSKAGAKRLDEMRASIRKHKGKTLARGKFSPDAKSPLTYLKGVA
jgi:hypothetical protein